MDPLLNLLLLLVSRQAESKAKPIPTIDTSRTQVTRTSVELGVHVSILHRIQVPEFLFLPMICLCTSKGSSTGGGSVSTRVHNDDGDDDVVFIRDFPAWSCPTPPPRCPPARVVAW